MCGLVALWPLWMKACTFRWVAVKSNYNLGIRPGTKSTLDALDALDALIVITSWCIHYCIHYLPLPPSLPFPSLPFPKARLLPHPYSLSCAPAS